MKLWTSSAWGTANVRTCHNRMLRSSPWIQPWITIAFYIGNRCSCSMPKRADLNSAQAPAVRDRNPPEIGRVYLPCHIKRVGPLPCTAYEVVSRDGPQDCAAGPSRRLCNHERTQAARITRISLPLTGRRCWRKTPIKTFRCSDRTAPDGSHPHARWCIGSETHAVVRLRRLRS